MLYGRHAILESLRGPRRPVELFVADGVREDDRVREMTRAASVAGIPISRVPRMALDDWSNRANHQGVILRTSPFPYAELDDLLSEPGTVIVLDHLQDPQNFGSLLRAAEATGVRGVIIPRDRAVAVTPAVVNASAGAVEHLRVVAATNLARAIEDLKKRGWWVAALDAGKDAADLFTASIPLPVALVIGAEGGGISSNLRKQCDLALAIPMTGKVASLNAATAGSIALFEIFRRDHAPITGRPP